MPRLHARHVARKVRAVCGELFSARRTARRLCAVAFGPLEPTYRRSRLRRSLSERRQLKCSRRGGCAHVSSLAAA